MVVTNDSYMSGDSETFMFKPIKVSWMIGSYGGGTAAVVGGRCAAQAA